MNLKLSGTSPDAFAKIALDLHAPITVELSSETKGAPLYLFVEPDDRSIIEIKVEPESGLLREFILVTLPREKVKLSETDAEGPSVPTEGRRPAFSLDAWPTDLTPKDWTRRQVRVKEDFQLTIGPSSAAISFLARTTPTAWVVNARVRFGLDEKGQLSRVDLFNLKVDEVALLKEAIALKP